MLAQCNYFNQNYLDSSPPTSFHDILYPTPNTSIRIEDIMKLAIFDFDGTLYKDETFNLFMDHLKNHPELSMRHKKFYASILFPYLSYKAQLYPEGKMKENLMKKYLNALVGLSTEEIRTFFDEVAIDMKESFHTEIVQRLEKHATNNVHTMIVSGAFTPVLETAVAHLPVDTIIGTDIPMKNNTYDRKRSIYHIQSMRKKVAVQNYFRGQVIDWENSYAYGDSYSDLPVLELVGNPIAVNPDDKLREVAVAHNWEIIL